MFVAHALQKAASAAAWAAIAAGGAYNGSDMPQAPSLATPEFFAGLALAALIGLGWIIYRLWSGPRR